jgi:hypothetical protein
MWKISLTWYICRVNFIWDKRVSVNCIRYHLIVDVKFCLTACPRDARFGVLHRYAFAHNSEMEDRRELSDVLNWRFSNSSELIKMFPWKFITKTPTRTFSLDFAKVGIDILVRNFQGNILMSSERFENKFLFNLKRHSTLYDLPFKNLYPQVKNNLILIVFKAERKRFFSRLIILTFLFSIGSLLNE